MQTHVRQSFEAKGTAADLVLTPLRTSGSRHSTYSGPASASPECQLPPLSARSASSTLPSSLPESPRRDAACSPSSKVAAEPGVEEATRIGWKSAEPSRGCVGGAASRPGTAVSAAGSQAATAPAPGVAAYVASSPTSLALGAPAPGDATLAAQAPAATNQAPCCFFVSTGAGGEDDSAKKEARRKKFERQQVERQRRFTKDRRSAYPGAGRVDATDASQAALEQTRLRGASVEVPLPSQQREDPPSARKSATVGSASLAPPSGSGSCNVSLGGGGTGGGGSVTGPIGSGGGSSKGASVSCSAMPGKAMSAAAPSTAPRAAQNERSMRDRSPGARDPLMISAPSHPLHSGRRFSPPARGPAAAAAAQAAAAAANAAVAVAAMKHEQQRPLRQQRARASTSGNGCGGQFVPAQLSAGSPRLPASTGSQQVARPTSPPARTSPRASPRNSPRISPRPSPRPPEGSSECPGGQQLSSQAQGGQHASMQPPARSRLTELRDEMKRRRGAGLDPSRDRSASPSGAALDCQAAAAAVLAQHRERLDQGGGSYAAQQQGTSPRAGPAEQVRRQAAELAHVQQQVSITSTRSPRFEQRPSEGHRTQGEGPCAAEFASTVEQQLQQSAREREEDSMQSSAAAAFAHDAAGGECGAGPEGFLAAAALVATGPLTSRSASGRMPVEQQGVVRVSGAAISPRTGPLPISHSAREVVRRVSPAVQHPPARPDSRATNVPLILTTAPTVSSSPRGVPHAHRVTVLR